jgi:hypothetical protein
MINASSPARWSAAALAAMLMTGAIGARPLEDAAPADPDRARPLVKQAVPSGLYMRSVEDPGRTVALEVATRTFVPADADGPKVVLVSVAHIAERELYGQLQAVLDAHDVVLYESVMPAGARGASGATDSQRAASTLAVMKFTAGALYHFHKREQRYPVDLSKLASFTGQRDPRLAQWLASAETDGWGRRIAYEVGEGGRVFVLTSLGADRAVGGAGADADIQVTSETAVDAQFQDDGQDNIQAELAKALGLAFQLDGIDYDRPHFRCSDMSMDQLQRAMQAEGLDMAPLEGSLGGSSLPGRIAVIFLRLMRMVDIFFDGVIADGMKVMLIELFSDNAFMEQSFRQFGDGFERVLIDQRNQIVIDDLGEILERERDVRSVAIFYGAAHMPDMAERLADQLGYRPDAEQWFTAFEVDLDESAMTPSQLQSLRRMIRQQLRMMSR